MPIGRPYKIWLLLIAACIISRLPELMSPNLLLDGDECVVAIMAKHMMTGKAFSAYFYGQAYGFSLIECLFIIPFYFLFGITTLSVKLAMLALWATGVLFLYKAFRLINKGYSWLPLLLILVFIWSPAWAVWSMKARGGYLTSFALTSIALTCLFRDKKSSFAWSGIGILCVVVYQSQPLWIPGLAPFLIYFLFRDKKILPLFAFILPIVLLSLFVSFYKHGMLEFGVIRADYTLDDLSGRIMRIPAFLYNSLHGNYFFDQIQKPNLFCASLAIVFEVIIFLLIVAAVYNVITQKKGTLVFNLSACSLVLTLSFTICAPGFQGRYLLPVTGYTLISLLLLLNSLNVKKKILYTAGYVYIIMGVVALVTFYNFSFSPTREKALKGALSYLTSNDVHYAYCYDNMFTWQVIFYSNEQVLCHEKRLPGRFPKYVWQVDSSYYSGAKAAFISQPGYPLSIAFPQSATIDGYYIAIDPPKEIMKQKFPRQTKRPKFYYCSQ